MVSSQVCVCVTERGGPRAGRKGKWQEEGGAARKARVRGSSLAALNSPEI